MRRPQAGAFVNTLLRTRDKFWRRLQSCSRPDLTTVTVLGRPDLLDRALMRPGRLDKLLYVGVAEDVASKAKVLRALTRKFKLAPSVDLDAVARECAPTYTGADLYALCADAWMAGLKRLVAEVTTLSCTMPYLAKRSA